MGRDGQSDFKFASRFERDTPLGHDLICFLLYWQLKGANIKKENQKMKHKGSFKYALKSSLLDVNDRRGAELTALGFSAVEH